MNHSAENMSLWVSSKQNIRMWGHYVTNAVLWEGCN